MLRRRSASLVALAACMGTIALHSDAERPPGIPRRAWNQGNAERGTRKDHHEANQRNRRRDRRRARRGARNCRNVCGSGRTRRAGGRAGRAAAADGARIVRQAGRRCWPCGRTSRTWRRCEAMAERVQGALGAGGCARQLCGHLFGDRPRLGGRPGAVAARPARQPGRQLSRLPRARRRDGGAGQRLRDQHRQHRRRQRSARALHELRQLQNRD